MMIKIKAEKITKCDHPMTKPMITLDGYFFMSWQYKIQNETEIIFKYAQHSSIDAVLL